eukprot:GHRR01018139.1.p1 GENE.GHRR01018139.1~~GHRR01018139.1.p1  ORF type:complete len:422 (+),score=129.73 GHRR01018139.1:489-1754(+)
MARLVPCAAARSLSSTQPMSKPIAFQGTLLYCDPHDVGKIKVLKDHVVIVCTKGVIGHVGPAAFSDSQLKAHSLGPEDVKQLTPTQFLLPGFIDTHLHAPQYQFCGVGTDLPLFEWLNQYTFPAEARFSDCQHAHKVYTLLVQRLLRLGTTTANYYTTLQAGACQLLADIVKAAGQRAVIGKVSMDQNSPDSYVELDPAASLKAAHDVVKYIQGLQCSRLMPAVVPRFIPTCSAELLRGLAALAQEHDLHVHSHIAESRDEVDFSTKLHPGHENDAEIYSAVGLLRPKAIFAHGTQLTDTALQLMAQKGAAIAHCPLSNMYFGDGLLDVCKTLRTGVRVGLGTDIAGGYSPSMLSAIRMAVVNSHAMKAAALMYGSQDKDQQALEQQQQPATQQQSSNSTNEVPKQQQAASGFNGGQLSLS